MRPLSLLPLPLLLLIPACKPKGAPGQGGAGSTLLDPGPAPVAEGWLPADHGVGFTIAFPQGWETKPLDQAAIQTVMQWQFTPALKKGRPVATWANAPVSFRIF